LSSFDRNPRSRLFRLALVQTVLLVVCAAPGLLEAQAASGTQACGGNYKEDRGRACNVLTLNKGKIRFKRLHVKPKNMLAYVPSTDLLLSARDKHRLRRWGISVNAWERGEPESFEMRIKKHFKRLK
jgi:hypothetical protein